MTNAQILIELQRTKAAFERADADRAAVVECLSRMTTSIERANTMLARFEEMLELVGEVRDNDGDEWKQGPPNDLT